MIRNFSWYGEMNFVDLVNRIQSPRIVVEVGCYGDLTTRYYV